MADSKSYTRASFTGFLLLILLVAGWVRIYDLNWDEGTHLHPDERYLTMVASALEIPQTTGEYWSTESSPLNPENRGYGGYVYGTLPLFAARLVGGWFDGACGETPKQLPAIARAVFFGAVAPCYPGLYVGYGGVHLIGRYLSTATDLLTLLALALLAKKLFGHHVALWAAALYAFAVLPIQHAHFFVVDSFATVFVVWTLYFALSAVENHEKWLLLLAGLTTGLAIASKVSTWPVAAMVGLAGILQRRLEENTPTENGADDRPRYVFTLDLTTILFLTASGLLAFCAFRIAQPYAFSGPGFFDLHLNPRWVESMKFIRELVSGTIDTPPGHQWANRLPIIFPWINMVFWGLGIPLGIASWFGWGMMGWRIARKTDWRGLLPWTWGTLFFLYQGIQWVKSMRYLLPVYPVFVLFAAVALVDLARWAYKRQLVNTTAAKIRKLGFFILRGVPWLVLAGAMTWAIAFMQIYVRPFTRIEASQWIYEHIPTTVTATTEKGLSIQIPLQPNAILIVEGAPAAASFTMPAEDRIISVSLNKARVTPTETTPPNVAITLAADQNFDDVLAYTEVLIPLSSSKSVHVAAPMETQRLAAGEVVHIQVRLLEGLPVTLATSILGNEHWDDSLPVRMDGKDPFRDWYRGLSSSSDSLMHLYDNDNAAKRQQLLAWLDEVDFVILSSNRLYGSIARLPLRYPLSIAYYRSLFDGSLGFDLVGEFVSFPALGPCQFEDQETPFSIPSPQYTNRRTCAIPYPAAEEAFSVYDHPRVLIFAKTSRYSRANAETLLSLALAETAQWMTPLQATRGSGNQVQLVMNTRVRLIQEAGGTWSALFDRETLQNRHPIVAAVRWWGLLTLVGWMAFPWLVTVFPRFYDHGYGLARAAGLLAWVYPGWLLASMHWAPHTRLLLWTTFLIWVIATGLLILRKRAYLATYLTTHWRDLARIEIIFTLLFFGWVLVRYLNPDFYHPVAAGEKPMDFAYLNATIKSTWFPPYDPWFAGGTMNYYYFGFVIIGAIAKFLGVAPSVAYNLAVPSLFAMTGVGAYSLAANLSAGSAPLNAACLKRARRAGVWGVVCVLLIGNLGELQLLIKGLAEVGALSFDSLIPGYELLVSAIVGFWKVVVEGVNLPFRPEWWYWNATRIIPPGPGEVAGPINEFPLFTFLYADLHAHAMALPLTQVALGVALQWGLRPPRRQPRRKPGQIQARIRQALHYLPLFILGGLATGALRATNTWDYPTYLALIGAGYLLPLLQKPSPLVVAAEDKPASSNLWQYLRLLVPLLILVLAELLFRPYVINNATVYTEFAAWTGRRTKVGEYFLIHGQFLAPLIVFACFQSRELIQRLLHSEDRGLWAALAIVTGGVIILTITMAAVGIPIALIVIPLGILAALMVLDTEQKPESRVLWFFVGTALALTLVVEIIVLKGDLGRMNTVFKFYLQVWMLLAVTGAVALEWLCTKLWGTLQSSPSEETLRGATRLAGKWSWAGDLLLAGLAVLLFTAALYPLFAIPGKIRDRWNRNAPYSLDGMACLESMTHYEEGKSFSLATEVQVMRWLQENVEGSPPIMEMNAAVEYITWGNRMSIYTGLPSVVGWRWHQVQQRMIMPGGTVENRQADVREFYNTPDINAARAILERYNVQYVIVTPYERALAQPEGIAKFTEMATRNWLAPVYTTAEATVYRVNRDTAPVARDPE